MSRRIIFGQPWFGPEEEDLLVQTLRSGWVGQGPLVERFERDLGAYLFAADVVAVNSCTTALHLALAAIALEPGDEVISTPMTFVATVNAIEHSGAVPVLVDVDPESMNLTPEAAAAALTDRTRAIMPVHFGGRPLDVPGFQRLADAHDLWLIEDAAHAIGAVAAGTRVGGSGHMRTMTCFSFYPNKNVASAEGGAVALADRAIADRIRRMRLHGLDVDAWKRYREHTYQPSLAVDDGFKGNWTDLQAALAIPQLERLEGFLATREYLAERYDEALAGVGVRRVGRGPNELNWRHALHLYQVHIEGGAERRNSVVHRLRAGGIGASVHYLGVNLHPHFEERWGAFPISDAASDSLVTLPLHPHLHDDDVAYVAAALVDALDAVGDQSATE